MVRKILLTGSLVAGLFAAVALTTGGAEAMTISTPAAVAKAVGEGNVSEVVYVCRRVWTQWGPRRSCWWRPGGYGYYGYGYRPYRYYGWRRPYYRRYWY